MDKIIYLGVAILAGVGIGLYEYYIQNQQLVMNEERFVEMFRNNQLADQNNEENVEDEQPEAEQRRDEDNQLRQRQHL